MCMLNLNTWAMVVELVDKWTKQRKRFTGWDVAQHLGLQDRDAREVGSCLRELFNGRAPCFKDYACYPVRGKVEPLLYFPVPAWVKRDGEKMQPVDATPMCESCSTFMTRAERYPAPGRPKSVIQVWECSVCHGHTHVLRASRFIVRE